MKTNVEIIKEKAEKEIDEIETWMVRLCELRYDYVGTEKYEQFDKIIAKAEVCVQYDPVYWQKVNKILEPIFQESD